MHMEGEYSAAHFSTDARNHVSVSCLCPWTRRKGVRQLAARQLDVAGLPTDHSEWRVWMDLVCIDQFDEQHKVCPTKPVLVGPVWLSCVVLLVICRPAPMLRFYFIMLVVLHVCVPCRCAVAWSSFCPSCPFP